MAPALLHLATAAIGERPRTGVVVSDAGGFILNCNDDDANRDLITTALEEGGFEVREVATGAEALDAAREGPALIVLDVNLPDISGLDVCRRLKGELTTSQIPVLQTSAVHTSSDAHAEGLDNGADAYLPQPVPPSVLLATVRALLRACQAEADCRRALAELVMVDRRKDEFLAMLAHELRNPLNAIAAANSLLERAGPQDAENARLREIVARQTRHLTRLVDDLLEVSRVTQGQVHLQSEAVDLRETIADALSSLAPQLDARRRQVVTEVPSEPVMVDGDPVRLEQVLVAIIDNACKYSEPDTRIRLTCVIRAEDVEVGIADEGVGIDPAQLDSIFDVFVQADRTLARSVGGLGVGLSIARRLVELHGGTVTAWSAGLGRGSQFLIRLPVLASGVQPARVEPTRAASDGHRQLDVLVIEDNRDTRELMRCLVETWGHRVAVAADGTSGLAAALTVPPDVALVDIGLPGLDGYEVARRLRTSAAGRDVLLIALTGYGQPEDSARALGNGFDVHLVKPVDAAQLERLLIDRSSAKAVGGAR